jgi:hypothetical protein
MVFPPMVYSSPQAGESTCPCLSISAYNFLACAFAFAALCNRVSIDRSRVSFAWDGLDANPFNALICPQCRTTYSEVAILSIPRLFCLRPPVFKFMALRSQINAVRYHDQAALSFTSAGEIVKSKFASINVRLTSQNIGGGRTLIERPLGMICQLGLIHHLNERVHPHLS